MVSVALAAIDVETYLPRQLQGLFEEKIIMGLREFNAGAKAAQSLDIEGISDLRRGDSEGHLTFRYNNGELYRSVEINILSQGTRMKRRKRETPVLPSYLRTC